MGNFFTKSFFVTFALPFFVSASALATVETESPEFHTYGNGVVDGNGAGIDDYVQPIAMPYSREVLQFLDSYSAVLPTFVRKMRDFIYHPDPRVRGSFWKFDGDCYLRGDETKERKRAAFNPLTNRIVFCKAFFDGTLDRDREITTVLHEFTHYMFKYVATDYAGSEEDRAKEFEGIYYDAFHLPGPARFTATFEFLKEQLDKYSVGLISHVKSEEVIMDEVTFPLLADGSVSFVTDRRMLSDANFYLPHQFEFGNQLLWTSNPETKFFLLANVGKPPATARGVVRPCIKSSNNTDYADYCISTRDTERIIPIAKVSPFFLKYLSRLKALTTTQTMPGHSWISDGKLVYFFE